MQAGCYANGGVTRTDTVVCTRPKPLQMRFRLESLMEEFKRGTAIREEFKGGTAFGVKYMKRMKLNQHN
jgi:hypothetical protein